ncbi:hypothetical protein A5819_003515 [Enterococcus sp. 7E2_DIV0204]|uniref:hypothetical protein n=1 Tax=unclassified Enterococcus TaxID=2608891 RepID=UPI000A358628|nr:MULTISPECIES: hypothetical protein [unclassified Enterococcus]OTN83965.1 hypothetical protein A5819_003515 [Enterococcus sp. 7E2_DIV0204]OTP46873.1 hypothetical protein A5884_003751 [Enterococcus sp. 7D2_DIV0200]
MNEQNHEPQQRKENKQIQMNRITSVQGEFKANEKIQLFIMWQVLNKRYVIGSKLFYDDIEAKVGANKQAYSKACMFLEGAGLIVDKVVIANKVPDSLVERFGLINESTTSKN